MKLQVFAYTDKYFFFEQYKDKKWKKNCHPVLALNLVDRKKESEQKPDDVSCAAHDFVTYELWELTLDQMFD